MIPNEKPIQNGFVSFNHDGSITRTEKDGSVTNLDIDPHEILGGMADCWLDYVERNKGKPFVPLQYIQPVPVDGGIWYQMGLNQAKENHDRDNLDHKDG